MSESSAPDTTSVDQRAPEGTKEDLSHLMEAEATGNLPGEDRRVGDQDSSTGGPDETGAVQLPDGSGIAVGTVGDGPIVDLPETPAPEAPVAPAKKGRKAKAAVDAADAPMPEPHGQVNGTSVSRGPLETTE